MAEHCMVIAGEWKTSADNHWNFVIDKEQMTRVVPLRNGITLTELLSNVFKEFYEKPLTLLTAVLSYWPPNSKELATGLTTPPVMLTNDGAVSFFYQHFQTNKGMNMFVTFRKTAAPASADQNPLPFTTPNQPIKRAHSPYSPDMRQASTAGSQIPGFSLFSDDELDMPRNSPHVQQPNCTRVHAKSCPLVQLPRSTGSHNASSSRIPKPSRISLIDETVIGGDQLLEDMFKEDPANIPDSWDSEDDDETGTDASIPADNVPNRGYDQDFWAPLLDTHLGGSDAAEVMAGITVPKTAPHIIHCTTGDAFDHTILVSGELPPYTKPEIGSFPVPPGNSPPVQQSSCPPASRPASYTGTRSKISPSREWSFSVRGLFGHGNTVHLDTKACTCQVFQKLKIPCGHALMAADSVGLSYTGLIGDYYKTQHWIDTYAGVIYPEADIGEFSIPPALSDFPLGPPRTRRPSGRPREGRIPSTGEIPPVKKTKTVPNKCTRCGGTGHNRTRCVCPI
ncbi:Uncharacterized protein Rs2_16528 [Raphanus sativus]|nr:Uncharacterized protein Rs2_16528 [Raphanus sativus]